MIETNGGRESEKSVQTARHGDDVYKVDYNKYTFIVSK